MEEQSVGSRQPNETEMPQIGGNLVVSWGVRKFMRSAVLAITLIVLGGLSPALDRFLDDKLVSETVEITSVPKSC